MSNANSIKIIEPSGILSATTAYALTQQLNECLEAKTKIILIDLQNVDFIDSSGLGTLVSMHTKLRLADGKLYLCSPKDQARNLFDISDTDRIFNILASRKEFDSVVVKKNQAIMVQ